MTRDRRDPPEAGRNGRNPLLAWLERPSARRGIQFADGRGAWRFSSYQELAGLAHRMAAGYRSVGVGPGDVVALIQTASPQFVAAFFGALAIGAVPAAIAPPAVFQDQKRYRHHLLSIQKLANPRLFVVFEDLFDPLSEFLPSADHGRIILDNSLMDVPAARDADPACSAGEASILQFTSGSGGLCKGVKVSSESMAANCMAIRNWLEWTEADETASWLPVYHDMGLVACLITPVIAQSGLWLMQPRHFIRDPLRFLALFDGSGAKLTAMPCFGLQWIVERVPRRRLAGMDFSGWRALVVGAEPVRASVLENFHALLGPFGLARETLLPAYGLAEATLAVTGLPLRRGWRVIEADRRRLAPGRPVKAAAASARQSGHACHVVGCGFPLQGVQVTVTDETGTQVADGVLGEVCVRGESVASGYWDGAHSPGQRFDRGVLRTGDAGMIRDGELFLFGRFGDSVKVRGRILFAEDLEALLAGLPSLRRPPAVIAGWIDEAPEIAIVLEQAGADVAARARAVAVAWAEGAQIEVINVPRGGIPYTSSGKVRRSILWKAYAGGEMEAYRVAL